MSSKSRFSAILICIFLLFPVANATASTCKACHGQIESLSVLVDKLYPDSKTDSKGFKLVGHSNFGEGYTDQKADSFAPLKNQNSKNSAKESGQYHSYLNSNYLDGNQLPSSDGANLFKGNLPEDSTIPNTIPIGSIYLNYPKHE